MMVVEEVEVVEVEEVAEVVGIPHHLQVVEEEGVHQMVVNLVLEVSNQRFYACEKKREAVLIISVDRMKIKVLNGGSDRSE